MSFILAGTCHHSVSSTSLNISEWWKHEATSSHALVANQLLNLKLEPWPHSFPRTEHRAVSFFIIHCSICFADTSPDVKIDVIV